MFEIQRPLIAHGLTHIQSLAQLPPTGTTTFPATKANVDFANSNLTFLVAACAAGCGHKESAIQWIFPELVQNARDHSCRTLENQEITVTWNFLSPESFLSVTNSVDQCVDVGRYYSNSDPLLDCAMEGPNAHLATKITAAYCSRLVYDWHLNGTKVARQILTYDPIHDLLRSEFQDAHGQQTDFKPELPADTVVATAYLKRE